MFYKHKLNIAKYYPYVFHIHFNPTSYTYMNLLFNSNKHIIMKSWYPKTRIKCKESNPRTRVFFFTTIRHALYEISYCWLVDVLHEPSGEEESGGMKWSFGPKIGVNPYRNSLAATPFLASVCTTTACLPSIYIKIYIYVSTGRV